MDPLKMYFLVKMRIFHCYVSLPEGNIPDPTKGQSLVCGLSGNYLGANFPKKYFQKPELFGAYFVGNSLILNHPVRGDQPAVWLLARINYGLFVDLSKHMVRMIPVENDARFGSRNLTCLIKVFLNEKTLTSLQLTSARLFKETPPKKEGPWSLLILRAVYI